jgi:hypothetical protein
MSTGMPSILKAATSVIAIPNRFIRLLHAASLEMVLRLTGAYSVI